MAALLLEWASVDETVTAGQEALAAVKKITGGDFPIAVIDSTGNRRPYQGYCGAAADVFERAIIFSFL
jgi:hypothetical protein